MDLDKAKKELEYKRMEMGIFEREFKIQERLADIERLKKSNEEAMARMIELKQETQGDE